MSSQQFTKKQERLLVFFVHFRYLSAKHIQVLFNYKDSRLSRSWIRLLESKQFIQKTQYKDLTTFPPTTIYCLDRKAKVYLISQGKYPKSMFRWLYKEKYVSSRFLTHHSQITYAYILLRRALLERKLHLTYLGKSVIRTLNLFTDYVPDGVFIIKKLSNKKKFIFLEVLDPFTPMRVHKQRFSHLLEEITWNNDFTHYTPTIIYVCPNQTVAYYLSRYIKNELDDYDTRVKIHYLQSSILQNASSDSLGDLL